MKCLDKNINNPLRRDGTSQAQRTARALLDEYVKIDERSQEDMEAYAFQLAELFQYYDFNNLPSGDWTSFFHQATSSEQPHYALFQTFLQLFHQARHQLNGLTQKHLSYYYEEVLGLEARAATPDRVMVLFELAKNVESQLVKKGVHLNAGPDEMGVERWYKTDEDLLAGKAKVKEIKSLYHTRVEQTELSGEIRVRGHHFYKDADTAAHDYSSFDQEVKQVQTIKVYQSDCSAGVEARPEIVCDDDEGLIADIAKTVPPYWKPFGKNQLREAASERIMETVDLGFATSSPLLLMEAGQRTISWHIKLRCEEPEKFDDILGTNIGAYFSVSINGKKEWIDITDFECRCSAHQQLIYLHFQIRIGAEVEPIQGYDQAVFQDPYETDWPVLRIFLNNAQYPTLYDLFSGCQPVLNNLQVQVNGLKNLVLQNELSPLDPTKPFQPFGPQPENGSYFLVGHPEAFQKSLRRLNFHLEWDKVPHSNFSTHYSHYPWSINNDTFQVDLRLLYKNNFDTQLKNGVSLFEANAADRRTINLPTGIPFYYGRKLEKHSFDRFDHSLDKGFVQMRLRTEAAVSDSDGKIGKLGLNFTGFGHKAFPRLYTDVLVKRANKTNADMPIPPEPYTPTLKSISMDYTASHVFLARPNDQEGEDRFYHIHPFGLAEKFYDPVKRKRFSFMPRYSANGYLYLGLESLQAGSVLTLYFQIAEGTADPALDFEKRDLSISVLVNNEWQALNVSEVLSDTSGGLQYTGIVKLNIPKQITAHNSLLTKGLHWISIEMAYQKGLPDRAEWFPGILGINTQAVSATFDDRDNDVGHYEKALAADSISSLVVKNAAVKKLHQPYSSFLGKPKESPINFFKRSSERLRHKNRSINIWDYERLILEAFPAIYKVKCLNHSNALTDIAPGEVYLVVISDMRNSNVGNPLQPLTSVRVMDQIEAYLLQHCNPFLQLKVANPIFEQVKVTFDVGFHSGYDEGFYKRQLNIDIVQYLSPWAYDKGEDIIIGGKIYASSILTFIERLEYVDYVTNFRMFHIYDSEGIGCMTVCTDFVVGGGTVETEVDIAIAQTARSVLTSAPIHCINTLQPGSYHCHTAAASISK